MIEGDYAILKLLERKRLDFGCNDIFFFSVVTLRQARGMFL